MKKTLLFLALATALFAQVGPTTHRSPPPSDPRLQRIEIALGNLVVTPGVKVEIRTEVGTIVVHVDTGAVDVPEGTTIPEAAKAFWAAVRGTWPGLKPGQRPVAPGVKP